MTLRGNVGSKKPSSEVKKAESTQFEYNMLATFPTVEEYCYQMMQGKSGYYSTGKVDFTKDFKTWASEEHKVEGLSASLAYQLFHIYKNLLESKALTSADAFNVLECGAGDGNLCFHIMGIIKKMAQIDPEWQPVFKALQYHIVELSPALAEKQMTRNAEYKEKVQVTQGSALNLKPLLKGIKIGAAISNELIDMFPPHLVICKDKNTYLVKQVLPFISISEAEKLVNTKRIAQLKQESLHNRTILSTSPQGITSATPDILMSHLHSPNHLLLSRSSFLELHQLIAQKPYCSQFTLIEVHCVSINAVPELKSFKERNPIFFESMNPYNERIVQTGIQLYLKDLQEKLLPNGEIITVDYGNNNQRAHFKLRTYKNLKIAFDIYKEPGYEDITCDVNMTVFAGEGERLGLHPKFYSKQAALSIDAYPDNVLSKAHKAKFRDSKPNFKVVIQSKQTASKDESHRFIGKSEPVTYAELASFKTLEYKVHSSGQLEIKYPESDAKLILEGINVIKPILKQAQEAYHSLTQSGKPSILVDGHHYNLEQVSETITYHQVVSTVAGKIINKKLITQAEKNELLTRGDFALIPSVCEYPTINKIIGEKLKELTDAEWIYQPAKDKNPAKASLILNDAEKAEAIKATLEKIGLTISTRQSATKSGTNYIIEIQDITLEKLYPAKPSEKAVETKAPNPSALFTHPTIEQVQKKLNTTTDLTNGLSWQYYPATQNRKAEARLMSPDQKAIDGVIDSLKEKHDITLTRKKIAGKASTEFVVQLKDSDIEKVTGIIITLPNQAASNHLKPGQSS